MQHYVDAFAARNAADLKQAEADCKKARAELAKARAAYSPKKFVAKYLGVSESTITQVKYSTQDFECSKFPGVNLEFDDVEAFHKLGDAVSAARAKVNDCCNVENEIKARGWTNNINKFRAFIRARYGAKPTVRPAEAIDAYLDSIKPVARKVK